MQMDRSLGEQFKDRSVMVWRTYLLLKKKKNNWVNVHLSVSFIYPLH